MDISNIALTVIVDLKGVDTDEQFLPFSNIKYEQVISSKSNVNQNITITILLWQHFYVYPYFSFT